MKTLNRSLIAALLCLLATSTFAQDAEMADTFRSDGKIYVVVAIILVVLAGFIFYLFAIDRKLSKMEKRFGDKEQTKS